MGGTRARSPAPPARPHWVCCQSQYRLADPVGSHCSSQVIELSVGVSQHVACAHVPRAVLLGRRRLCRAGPWTLKGIAGLEGTGNTELVVSPLRHRRCGAVLYEGRM